LTVALLGHIFKVDTGFIGQSVESTNEWGR
jgi:hypothetical protein